MAVKALIKKRPLAARTASAVPTQSAVVPSERSLDVQTAEDAQPFIEIKATADDDTVTQKSPWECAVHDEPVPLSNCDSAMPI